MIDPKSSCLLQDNHLLERVPLTPLANIDKRSKRENPYDYFPPAPLGRRRLARTLTPKSSKTLISKRLFLHLDDVENRKTEDFLFPVPRLSPETVQNRYKKFKAVKHTFNKKDASNVRPILKLSLQRLHNNESILQRLKQEKQSQSNNAFRSSSASAFTRSPGTIVEGNPEQTDASSSNTSVRLPPRRSMSTNSSHLSTDASNQNRTPPKRSQSGSIPLGRGVVRRHSGVARCA